MTAHARLWGTLPSRYADRRVATSTVDAAGRIVAFLVAPDARCWVRGPAPDPYTATIVVLDGKDVTEVAVPDLDLHFPKVDVLGDGFVLADARCRMPEGPAPESVAELEAQIPRNARVIGADGSTRGTFHAGDGIEYLMTDAAGDIWIGYFDEASVCVPLPERPPRSRGRAEPARPFRTMLDRPGLIRWTGDGTAAWLAAYDGNGPRSGWLDCYSLNVGATRTWACPYTGFPLVEIDGAGVRCVRRNPIHWAFAVLVAGDRLAFATYDDGEVTMRFGRVTDGPIEATTSEPLHLPGSAPRAVAARDDRMWMAVGSSWHVVTI
ncbi:hypothetical protein [Actinoplanes sp. NPDC089786]|uniref:hypothetical protein n=1 Tax=Actinoplanes sp. NPDC089786 TaxID=3155185 RepID=UPI00342D3B67